MGARVEWKGRGRRVLRASGRVAKVFAKFAFALVVSLLILVVAAAGFFFWKPEFRIGEKQIRSLAERFVPGTLALNFDEFEILIQRPEGLPFSKRVSLQARNLCVRYEGEAVRSCIGEAGLALTGGWSGKLREDETWFMPRLLEIEPVSLLSADVNVDLPKFPEDKEEPKEESSFDVVAFLRKQILPKWRIDGSRIDLDNLKIVTAREDGQELGYQARFDLYAEDQAETVRAIFHQVRSLAGDFDMHGRVRLIRPDGELAELLEDKGPNQTGRRIWKVYSDAWVDLPEKRSVKVLADADIENFRTLDFRVGTKFRGIAALREARVEGALRNDDLDGRFSLKVGSAGTQVRALDFVNCDVDANLAQKVGGIKCGPQTVRLIATEQEFLQNPRFFTFAPEFDLRITRVEFGDDKAADFTFDMALKHMGFLAAKTHIDGQVLKPLEGDLRYSIKGDLDLEANPFRDVVKLLAPTRFAVPAPLNVLNGRVGLGVRADLSEARGELLYQLKTDLESPHQVIRLTLDGDTDFEKKGSRLVPSTDMLLNIARFQISAPRFDLRAPPRLQPDSRFGPIDVSKGTRDPEPTAPMDFRLRIKTAEPEAIKIATNLTKGPIPLTLDLLYDDRKRPEPRVELKDSARGPASIRTGEVHVIADTEKEKEKEALDKPAVTGTIIVGRTPIDLFRRNAVIQKVRLDLLKDGQQKINGDIAVNYLDYQIQMLVLGETKDPVIKFQSDPPLEKDEIIAVLLFGRPLQELGDEEKSSVGSLNAAFADAALGVSSMYLLASTPVESVGYDPQRGLVTAKVGLGGGTSLELGGGADSASAVGIQKRLSKEFVFRSDVEKLGASGKRTVSALVEWVKRF